MQQQNSLRVILVRPLHSSNLGLACRVMKNFGFKQLVIVQPAKKVVKTKTAYMYAKHSKEVLQDARVVPSLEDAVSDFDVVIGTTGVPNRFHRQLKQCIPLSDVPGKLSGKVAIVFGSEGSGLTDDESAQCDWLAFIPTNPEHPVLNLSHAVAVMLHLLSGASWEPQTVLASVGQRRILEDKFTKLIAGSPRVNDHKKVALAFRKIVGKAQTTDDEVRTLMAGLAALEKRSRKGAAGLTLKRRARN